MNELQKQFDEIRRKQEMRPKIDESLIIIDSYQVKGFLRELSILNGHYMVFAEKSPDGKLCYKKGDGVMECWLFHRDAEWCIGNDCFNKKLPKDQRFYVRNARPWAKKPPQAGWKPLEKKWAPCAEFISVIPHNKHHKSDEPWGEDSDDERPVKKVITSRVNQYKLGADLPKRPREYANPSVSLDEHEAAPKVPRMNDFGFCSDEE